MRFGRYLTAVGAGAGGQRAAATHARTRLSPSEIMTILILFQQSGYRTFKGFYTQYVQTHLRAEFPQLVSYSRFVALIPRVLLPLAVYLHTQMGRCTGISFIDSTSLSRLQERPHRPASRLSVDARRGKTSVGWFYGFKLHLVVNDRGEVLAVCLTPGNVDDRRPVPRLVRRLFGKLFGDRGYISQALAEQLFTTQGIRLITKVRTNMRDAAAGAVPTSCCCANGRSSRASTTNSRTSARSSTRRHRSPSYFSGRTSWLG